MFWRFSPNIPSDTWHHIGKTIIFYSVGPMIESNWYSFTHVSRQFQQNSCVLVLSHSWIGPIGWSGLLRRHGDSQTSGPAEEWGQHAAGFRVPQRCQSKCAVFVSFHIWCNLEPTRPSLDCPPPPTPTSSSLCRQLASLCEASFNTLMISCLPCTAQLQARYCLFWYPVLSRETKTTSIMKNEIYSRKKKKKI